MIENIERQKWVLKAKLAGLIKKRLGYTITSSNPPFPCLVVDNLYAYLDALYKKRRLDGAILEVGCAYGAAAAVAYTFLARQGLKKEYVCIDTFKGFVPTHTETDRKIGLPPENELKFSDNSVEAVQENLRSWGIHQIKLVEGDIVTIDDSLIPSRIYVCLIDVDLKIPVYERLKRVYPRLQDGGVILVDDCTDGTSWVGALQGYKQFVAKKGLDEKYFMSFGVVENNSSREPLNWPMSSRPFKETHYNFRSSTPITFT